VRDPPPRATRIRGVRAVVASLLAVLACLAFAANGSPGAAGTAGAATSAAGAAGTAGAATSAARGRPARAYFPGTGTWYEIQNGHLVVGRAGVPRWRSTGLFANRWRLGVVAAGRQGVAFSYHGWLYIARRGGAERRVVRHEGAVGWTTDGVYTYGTTLVLRSDTGTRIRTVARRPQQHAYDPATGTLYLVDHGALIKGHGPRVRQMASLKGLGLPPRATQLIPLEGLVELESANRIVILRPDGARYASTPVPRDATISSGLAVAPGQMAIAFTAAYGLSDDPNTTRRAHGTEIIYVLRARARKAIPLHTEHVTFKVCERGASVTWHGGWLRYTNSEGNAAAVRVTTS
jgi:hypothetical protein